MPFVDQTMASLMELLGFQPGGGNNQPSNGTGGPSGGCGTPDCGTPSGGSGSEATSAPSVSDLNSEFDDLALKVQDAVDAGHPVTLVVVEDANHLFQTAETGALAEYSQIEETFAPETLALLVGWIAETAGPGE